jgi:hypothetical protein
MLNDFVLSGLIQVVDMAIKEVGAYLLQALAELIEVPSPKLSLLMSHNVTKRRFCASSATRRSIVSTWARR